MVCPECGAHLESSDQFCPGCGVRIIRKKRCPECGEMLREGTRFCPSCGEEIPEDYFTRKKSSARAAPKKKANAAPPPKKRPVRDREEEDWDDEEDEESVDVLTIMTVAVGCILLVIIAVLGFNLFQRYMPKNYDKAAQKQEEEGEEADEQEDEEDGQQLEENNYEEASAEVSEGGTLVIVSNVNVRDNPDTQGTKVIKVAQAGESYDYTEVVDGGMWYKVLLPDESDYDFGYVYADYIKLQ
ncbi:MAG: zinc-ribbon domain-containing protein [Lachnospiraceae bacterium]|nr:zinc-ribbon domain-containing protein [Lachnospiraceae bacterium]